MEIKTKTKLIRCLILIWFSLQAVFMIYWPLYLHYQCGLDLYDFYRMTMLVVGCVLLLSSLLIVIQNNIIRRIATIILWIYSVPFDLMCYFFLTLAGTRDIFVLVLTTIYIVNIVLLILKHYYSMTYCDRWINVGHIYSKNIPIGITIKKKIDLHPFPLLTHSKQYDKTIPNYIVYAN